jgi:hypothetical protein
MKEMKMVQAQLQQRNQIGADIIRMLVHSWCDRTNWVSTQEDEEDPDLALSVLIILFQNHGFSISKSLLPGVLHLLKDHSIDPSSRAKWSIIQALLVGYPDADDATSSRNLLKKKQDALDAVHLLDRAQGLLSNAQDQNGSLSRVSLLYNIAVAIWRISFPHLSYSTLEFLPVILSIRPILASLGPLEKSDFAWMLDVSLAICRGLLVNRKKTILTVENMKVLQDYFAFGWSCASGSQNGHAAWELFFLYQTIRNSDPCALELQSVETLVPEEHWKLLTLVQQQDCKPDLTKVTDETTVLSQNGLMSDDSTFSRTFWNRNQLQKVESLFKDKHLDLASSILSKLDSGNLDTITCLQKDFFQFQIKTMNKIELKHLDDWSRLVRRAATQRQSSLIERCKF